ncbi:hypothetical protein [Microbacterium saperdae]|uniref:Uncharacterized protein n=1 Tax=Microbacterium saperdae TaxID=69368 RepID=A0A543BLW8_9MICO|nr:hypothetical protein [Microbacterium saperdae]TQL85808.1 hypothetical protein FB560_1441 [Microbacterium saperdae]GGM52874.1 hypothetical protein GCM10010489_25560 [Microbacterium saperdae]
MSTSDQQEQGPLTRKQLREIRLTGSTPVITPEDAAAAATADMVVPPAPPLPQQAESLEVTPAPAVANDADADVDHAPLTRRQARAQERVRTASVPVVGAETESGSDEVAHEASPAEEAPVAEEAAVADSPAIVSAVPDFARPVPSDVDDDDEGVDDIATVEPVSAVSAADSVGEVPLEVVDEPADDVAALGLDSDEGADDVLADVADTDDDVRQGERPTVNPAFGEELLGDTADAPAPFTPSFDELLSVSDSTGSQHIAPSALIFTPSPGEGSLSGPVASTGEILVTGSYELPQGIGSQGHAHGTTDGKEVDAVLIDGELPPASSPTPIAASSAVSTIKPAGEVIRPPAPEKGNKLMLILAITAGGLALALGVVLIFAFTTNVF